MMFYNQENTVFSILHQTQCQVLLTGWEIHSCSLTGLTGSVRRISSVLAPAGGTIPPLQPHSKTPSSLSKKGLQQLFNLPCIPGGNYRAEEVNLTYLAVDIISSIKNCASMSPTCGYQ